MAISIDHVNDNIVFSGGTVKLNGSTPGGGSSTLTIDNKTANYTVVSGDNGKIINCTSGTFTVSLTAAASLGAGFNVTIWNTGTGVITIDPNASETIDGLSNYIIRSNEGCQIVCDGTNWETGAKKTMRYYAENVTNRALEKATAPGSQAIALGGQSLGSNSITFGRGTSAGVDASSAIGQNSGFNGSVTASGAGAMALGGSYASGIDSFAAGIGNNTNTYGAIASNSFSMGDRSKSSGNYAFALGYFSLATGTNSFAIGPQSEANNQYAFALGYNNTASAYAASALGGMQNTASGQYSLASGFRSVASLYGKKSFASGRFDVNGDAQSGNMVLRRTTTDATTTVITSDDSTPGLTNQVILPNNSTYTFRIQVVGMQQAAGGTNTAGYTFEGVIRRGANAAATVLKNSIKTVLQEDVAGWDCNVSADTTNGGLAVTVTGAAGTNIRWVATVNTTEVTYA